MSKHNPKGKLVAALNKNPDLTARLLYRYYCREAIHSQHLLDVYAGLKDSMTPVHEEIRASRDFAEVYREMKEIEALMGDKTGVIKKIKNGESAKSITMKSINMNAVDSEDEDHRTNACKPKDQAQEQDDGQETPTERLQLAILSGTKRPRSFMLGQPDRTTRDILLNSLRDE